MTIEDALRTFAQAVTAKMSQLTRGEPEDQLRGPFENFMAEAGCALGWNVVCTGETRLAERLGKPDYGVNVNKLLAGYVELKAPGAGADTKRFTGHNREQWKRFQSIPNLIYCDGNEWALYRTGKPVGKVVRIRGDITSDGKEAVGRDSARGVERLLRDFLSWEPIIPTDKRGKTDLKRYAALLAPLCRLLREDVTDALKRRDSPLNQIASDWRQLLFPEASDERFADAYAQTVTFALLLGRSEGADPLTLNSAEAALAADHTLLSRALQVLTDERARDEMSASLDMLQRVIAAVPPASLSGTEDPWLYFYEDFLAAYDPELRKDAGAYFTPVEVVHAQVRLIDDLLVKRFSKSMGFADSAVVTLDPAVGTGTYLLGVIEHTLSKIETEQGAGAIPGQASKLAANLYAFEIMVGPYAVAELRVSQALRDRGASLPAGGSHIYLTDTLESPHAEPPQLPLFFKPISDQHAQALKVKKDVPVIVCLGNPPYDRHPAAAEAERAVTGGWVRWGDDGETAAPILRDFVDPAITAGHGGDVKNLYNLYVYFWRWALWKVFECETAKGPGIASFISASSYLDGDAFSGMREHMRRLCDEIWIIDVGGEGRGARKEENIFAIQTPVAIAIAVRGGKTDSDQPAVVRYSRISGARDAKLKALDGLSRTTSVKWEECPTAWQGAFRPAGKGLYFEWPLLIDLMPWQHSGVQLKRTWPIAPDRGLLERRWRELLNAKDRGKAFRETSDRKITSRYKVPLTSDANFRPIAELDKGAPTPQVVRYAYRSFDRQYVIADGRLMSRPRPDLWSVNGDNQIYITSLFTELLGVGPALVASSFIPDLHHFSGRGAKDAVPLYRNGDASEANIAPGFLQTISKTFGCPISPRDFLAYVYGVLAQPAFTARFADELETRELHVPITKDSSLFAKVRDVGARLLWLHTYGERFIPKGKQRGQILRGEAKCVKAVPGDQNGYPESFSYDEGTRTLRVGAGEFAPVDKGLFEFEVSGLKVVRSWLGYRMKKGAGRKSSPLDHIRPERWLPQFTTELLELLWVLEATIKGYPEQEALLEAVLAGPCFSAGDIPPTLDEMGKPPADRRRGPGYLEEMD
jgi:hypothetical protein